MEVQRRSPAVVDFYADWWPVQNVSPILDELSVEYEGKVKVYKVNTEKEPEVARALHFKHPDLVIHSRRRQTNRGPWSSVQDGIKSISIGYWERGTKPFFKKLLSWWRIAKDGSWMPDQLRVASANCKLTADFRHALRVTRKVLRVTRHESTAFSPFPPGACAVQMQNQRHDVIVMPANISARTPRYPAWWIRSRTGVVT